MDASTASTAPPAPVARRLHRALPWAALVALLLVAQSALLALTVAYEASRVQDQVDAVAAVTAAELKRDMLSGVQSLQALMWNGPAVEQWRAAAAELLHARRELLHIELRDARLEVQAAVDSPYRAPTFSLLPRAEMSVEADLACAAARRSGAPQFSRSYFVPQAGGQGLEVLDVCIPVQTAGAVTGFVVASHALTAMLEQAVTPEQARGHELSFVEGDGTRLARAGVPRGAGVYQAQRVVDLPGSSLQLRIDSAAERPRLIPNLATALVLGLSLALFGVVVLLLRDVRRRASAEAALAEALAFRKAMEDSLITGLRARDLDGRITYVNPAFCKMVGFAADELMGAGTPPYWPPERVDEYRQRQSLRLAEGRLRGDTPDAQQGFETVFLRRDGERIPVMIYEAPLVDGTGRHTGWMSAVLDMSAQRRVEELSRQQQERLQASARLATMGEMASLLSHEINQPLAAIASYASGSLNLVEEPDEQTLPMVRQALGRIAEQAERAGRVIKSVHDFVRRREHAREPLRAEQLLDAVMPLVRLLARKTGTRIELQVEAELPRVLADRTMIEQVLLNLARNAIQAMETTTPLPERVLQLVVQRAPGRWVRFAVVDAGPGIAPEVAQQLFTPFFTTRDEGMGLGLSLCRTVVEQHGGALDYDSRPGRTEFRFTLPAELRVRAPAQATA